MEPKTARRPDDRIANRRNAPDLPKIAVSKQGAAQLSCSATSTVMTLAGEKLASALEPGDKIITRDSGTAILRSVSSKRVICDAMLVKAGSLGHTRPPEDAILPASAQLLVRDWRAQALFGAAQAFAEVSALKDGEFIVPLPNEEMTLVTLGFDKSHILYIAGLEVVCTA